jgi:hypothetical protein
VWATFCSLKAALLRVGAVSIKMHSTTFGRSFGT